MLRHRHHHLHAVVPATTTTTSPAAPDPRTSSTSAACRSSQQAAAAWAWFEHGGSSCITPSKAEGLVAAQRRAKHTFTKPSRFRLEVLIRRQIPQKGSAEHAVPEDGYRFDTRRRRHSFHDDRTLYMYRRFSSSCRKAPGSPCVNFDVDGTIGDQSEAENELEGTGDSLCQDDAYEGSSLLDKFEVEAVRRQLHDQLMSRRISPSCSSPSSSSTCSTEAHDDHESHKSRHDHRHHHTHLKPRRSFKSGDAAAGHKPVADNEHHHHINDMVHRLLHLRTKTSSGRSISSALAPAICSSIATANSIVDHHHSQSPKHQKATSPIINQMAKRQHAALHNWGSMQNVVNGVSAAADAKHARQDFTLKHNHKSHQKEAPRRDHELIGDGVLSTPSSLHHSDSKFSKALLRPPLVSHLPRLSALALGHHKHGAKSWKDDGALAALQALSNRHSHVTSEHHHIHHHHHHYYHHLEHTNEALKGAHARVRHFLQEGDAVDHVLQAPNLYNLLEEELAIPAADHGRGPAQPRKYVAAQNRVSRQSASRSKLQKL